MIKNKHTDMHIPKMLPKVALTFKKVIENGEYFENDESFGFKHYYDSVIIHKQKPKEFCVHVWIPNHNGRHQNQYYKVVDNKLYSLVMNKISNTNKQ